MTDRELMQMALDAMRAVSVDEHLCNAAHHIKKDRHGIDEPCPIAKRFNDIAEALHARLAQPEPEPVAWTEREIELIDGMVEVQIIHTERCDSMPNRAMAEKQKGWNMERIQLLRKIRNTAPLQREWQGLTDEPIGWIYEDDEGRITFSQTEKHPPFWEPVYKAKNA